MKEKIFRWLADRMPSMLVYFCGVRIFAHATTGIYSDEIVPEVTMMEALMRWDEGYDSSKLSMYQEI